MSRTPLTSRIRRRLRARPLFVRVFASAIALMLAVANIGAPMTHAHPVSGDLHSAHHADHANASADHCGHADRAASPSGMPCCNGGACGCVHAMALVVALDAPRPAPMRAAHFAFFDATYPPVAAAQPLRPPIA